MGMAIWQQVKMLFKKEVRILMVGLDNTGQTTILYKLKLGGDIYPIPTVVFNLETVEYKNVSFRILDAGGSDLVRPRWRHWCLDSQGLIFVIDSDDRERIWEAKCVLHAMLIEEPLCEEALLVFANKQDIPNAMTVSEITDILGLHSLHPRRWHIQGSCAISGEGLYEGLDWLASNIYIK